MYLLLHSDKSKELDAFKIYKVEVEKQLGKQIKIVKLDTGRYTKKGQLYGLFARFLQEQGIVAQYIMPSSPSQNGVAERKSNLERYG